MEAWALCVPKGAPHSLGVSGKGSERDQLCQDMETRCRQGLPSPSPPTWDLPLTLHWLIITSCSSHNHFLIFFSSPLHLPTP